MSADPTPPVAWYDPERYATPLAVAGGVAVVAGVGLGGTTGAAAAAGGVALLLVSAYSRRDGLLVLGPFVTRELVLTARRPQLYVHRAAVVLVALLYAWVVARAVLGVGWPELGSFRATTARVSDATAAALLTFFGLAFMLYLFAAALAGFTVPPVVAEEREADRLDHLLVTDLRNREIVLGKAIGRLANLVGFALLPVPVMFLLTLLGGVDVWYVVSAAGLVAGTLAGLVGIALACSAARRRVASAVAATWVLAAVYLALTGAMTAAGAALGTTARPAGDILDYVGSGNPFVTGYRLVRAGVWTTLDTQAVPVLRSFVAVNLAVLAAGWWYAVRNVRREPRPVVARRAATRRPREAARPGVSDRPVLWYERMHTAAAGARRFGPRAWVWAWVVLGLIGVWVCTDIRTGRTLDWALTRATGPLTLALVTIPTGWRASRALARERERQTLDGLRLTELTPSEIVLQKWWAAVLAGARALAFVAGLWAVAFAAAVVRGETGRWVAEHGPVVAFGLGTAAANGLMAASLGQLTSVVSRTQAQATGRLFWWSAAWAAVVAAAWVYDWVGYRTSYLLLVAFPPAAQGLAGRLLSDTTLTPGEAEGLVTAYSQGVAVALTLAVVLEVVAVILYRRQFSTRAERPAEGTTA
jgi:ABC-type Na+ efflux pump permease subunit